jgi:hypothetical protein
MLVFLSGLKSWAKNSLGRNSDLPSTTPKDEELLRFIKPTKVYSNIDSFSQSQNIYRICQDIQNIKQNSNSHPPLSENASD